MSTVATVRLDRGRKSNVLHVSGERERTVEFNGERALFGRFWCHGREDEGSGVNRYGRSLVKVGALTPGTGRRSSTEKVRRWRQDVVLG